MFNGINSSTGTPPPADHNQQRGAGQAPRPFMSIIAVPSYIIAPMYTSLDQRSSEVIWSSYDQHELRGDYHYAYFDLMSLASRSDAEAFYRVGQYNFLALGRPESLYKADVAFRKAASLGHLEARKMVDLFDQYPILRRLG